MTRYEVKMTNTDYIPLGFSFKFDKLSETNDIFKELDKQGFKVIVNGKYREIEDIARKLYNAFNGHGPYIEEQIAALNEYAKVNDLKIKVICDCSIADECPQGKRGGRCTIWKENK